MVQAFARISILNTDAFEHLRQVGLVNADGELRSSVDVFQRLASTLTKMATSLFLTPAALGKLDKRKPIDLASAMSAEVVDADPE